MNTIRRLWREQRLVFIVFLIATGLALFFAGRGISRALYWADPAHQRQAPEAWMTPGYIAHSWHIRIEEVDAALGIENGPQLVGQRRPTLDAIAQALDVPVDDLIGRLDAVLPEIAAAPEARP